MPFPTIFCEELNGCPVNLGNGVVLHGASRARVAASICSPCSPVVGIGCRLFRPVYAFTGQVEFNCSPRSPLVGSFTRTRQGLRMLIGRISRRKSTWANSRLRFLVLGPWGRVQAREWNGRDTSS
jgi:hypothetical protein